MISKINGFDYTVNSNEFEKYNHTQFTATTVTKINEIYEEVKNKLPCRLCNVNCVDAKIEVKDTHNPTFVVTRKHACLSCWLQSVKL